MANLKVRLMLDSGVFSAWKKGLDLPIKEYIAYLRANEEWLYSYVVVDAIPGKRGVRRTQEQVEQSAKMSYKNLQLMKDKGLKPIPVFHQGEDFRWLERMIKDGERYIGISSAKDLPASDQGRWLESVFSVITDSKGCPLLRTHGFGISKPAFLARYPWFTCDSTTWSIMPGYGRILVPGNVNGKRDYTQSFAVHISDVQSDRPVRLDRKSSFDFMGPKTREWVVSFLQQEVGITLTDARYNSDARRQAVLTFFKRLCETRQVSFRASAVVQHINVDRSTLKPMKHDLSLMFATSINNRGFSTLLNGQQCYNRLLSYWDTREYTDAQLAEYVKTGILTKARVIKRSRWNWSDKQMADRRRKLIEKYQGAMADGT